ncbi:MAG: hypothetical protein JOZ15_00550, partial [Acidobacteria bacterium]|nr:hypothetical protein [Acidobacteriota bacterium]
MHRMHDLFEAGRWGWLAVAMILGGALAACASESGGAPQSGGAAAGSRGAGPAGGGAKPWQVMPSGELARPLM